MKFGGVNKWELLPKVDSLEWDLSDGTAKMVRFTRIAVTVGYEVVVAKW